uniref:Uncharacterized protein n=1 Tax=Anopheles stephensi TaxID=30069 RepID=A0A182YEP6_ANOST
MVHFCKLCQLLHKNMDFIQCDDSNVWLLETVFSVKITPINGRVEPICRKCIRKYNKVMKDLKKSNGGFPVSRQTFIEHNKFHNGDAESLFQFSNAEQPASLSSSQGRSLEQHPYLMDDESKELMFTGQVADKMNGSQNGMTLNISGEAATVYRITMGDTQESSDEDSSDGKSTIADEDESSEDSSEDDEDDDDDCCSDDTDDSSSSCSSTSSTGGSSSETGASLRLDEHIDRKTEESTALYSAYMDAPIMHNLPEGSLLQGVGDDDVVADGDRIFSDKTLMNDVLEPLQLAESLAKIEDNIGVATKQLQCEESQKLPLQARELQAPEQKVEQQEQNQLHEEKPHKQDPPAAPDEADERFALRGRYRNHMKQVHQRDVQDGDDDDDDRDRDDKCMSVDGSGDSDNGGEADAVETSVNGSGKNSLTTANSICNNDRPGRNPGRQRPDEEEEDEEYGENETHEDDDEDYDDDDEGDDEHNDNDDEENMNEDEEEEDEEDEEEEDVHLSNAAGVPLQEQQFHYGQIISEQN